MIKLRMMQDAEKTVNYIKQKISPAKLKVAIKNRRNSTNGNVTVRCSNKSDMEILKSETESRLGNYEIQIMKIKKPRIKTNGYESDLMEDVLENSSENKMIR